MTPLDKILEKETFNIKDLANITKKGTQTIRAWEKKGIIPEADMRDHNGWRIYSRKRTAEVLNQLISFAWKRQVIRNIPEIQYIIDELTKLDSQAKETVNEQ